MESDGGRLTAAAQAEWLLIKAKLALALAIIKTRPDGMSGRQHAEELSRQLTTREQSWREEARRLQQEVLMLRQTALTATLTAQTTLTATVTSRGSQMADFASQDLFDQGSAECGVDNGSETPDLMLDDQAPPPVVDPPPTLCLPTPGDSFPHMQFLRSLCALRRAHLNSRAALWLGPDGSSLVADSVCDLLDCLVKACRDPPTREPPDLVLEACGVAARAMDLLGSWRTEQFKNHLEKVMTELTELLLHHSDGPAAEKLAEYLMVLGSSSNLRFILIRHSISEICTLTNQLWQAFQNESQSSQPWFPLRPYQSSCHLFTVLEVLVQRLEAWQRVEVREERKEALSLLQSRSFALSEEFPLFAVRLWRITCLLSSS